MASLVDAVTVSIEGESGIALAQVSIQSCVASAGLAYSVAGAGSTTVWTCEAVSVAIHEEAADTEALSVVEESVALAAEALVAVGTGAAGARVMTVHISALVAIESKSGVALALTSDHGCVGST